jgi:hypothetical protein
MTNELFVEYVSRSDARQDPDFERYEVPTRALKALSSSSGSSFIAVGLKGVGKSAAFRYLQQETPTEVIQTISAESQEPRDIAVSLPTLQYVPEIRSELVLQALTAYRERSKFDMALLKKVPVGLNSRVGIHVDDVWNRLKEAVGQVGGVTILGVGISLRDKRKVTVSPFRLAQRGRQDQGRDLLLELTKHVKFRIVVDDPEAIFAADEHVNENLLAALAIASHELHIAVNGFKCVILIKPNVLRALRRVGEVAPIFGEIRRAA